MADSIRLLQAMSQTCSHGETWRLQRRKSNIFSTSATLHEQCTGGISLLQATLYARRTVCPCLKSFTEPVKTYQVLHTLTMSCCRQCTWLALHSSHSEDNTTAYLFLGNEVCGDDDCNKESIFWLKGRQSLRGSLGFAVLVFFAFFSLFFVFTVLRCLRPPNVLHHSISDRLWSVS